ncbi:hypothetical protein ACX80B_17665, partial [Arthrobacter monumenti]
ISVSTKLGTLLSSQTTDASSQNKENNSPAPHRSNFTNLLALIFTVKPADSQRLFGLKPDFRAEAQPEAVRLTSSISAEINITTMIEQKQNPVFRVPPETPSAYKLPRKSGVFRGFRTTVRAVSG